MAKRGAGPVVTAVSAVTVCGWKKVRCTMPPVHLAGAGVRRIPTVVGRRSVSNNTNGGVSVICAKSVVVTIRKPVTRMMRLPLSSVIPQPTVAHSATDNGLYRRVRRIVRVREARAVPSMSVVEMLYVLKEPVRDRSVV